MIPGQGISMKPLLLSLLFLLPAIAFGASEQKHSFSATLAPGGMHEECVKLKKGESRRFEWSSDAALDFNIHYHDGTEVFYPVKRDSVMKDKGTFKAKVAQDYCWMWTARTPAKIDGKIEK